MNDLHPFDLRRLRVGLIALILALGFDVIDFRIAGLPLFHDGIALAFFLAVALLLGHPTIRGVRGAPVVAWLPFATRAVVLALALIDGWPGNVWLVQISLLVLHGGSLVLLALMLSRVATGAGLVSSPHWRGAALGLVVFGIAPGALLSIFFRATSADLPFLHAVEVIDPAWWTSVLRWVLAGLGALSALWLGYAAWTTQVSAGRRT